MGHVSDIGGHHPTHRARHLLSILALPDDHGFYAFITARARMPQHTLSFALALLGASACCLRPSVWVELFA